MVAEPQMAHQMCVCVCVVSSAPPSFVLQGSHCACCCSPPTDIWYLPPLVCLLFLALLPIWVLVAQQNPQTREVLRSGWQPVIVAMSISRCVFQRP